MTSRDWKADVDAIRTILLTDWDPIGCGVPDDEYDSYIGGIYGLMQNGATAESLARHLNSIESESMGLAVNPKTTERNLVVANSLLGLLN
jgi:hypothetical protein